MKYFSGALLLVFATVLFAGMGLGWVALVCAIFAGYGIRRATHG